MKKYNFLIFLFSYFLIFFTFLAQANEAQLNRVKLATGKLVLSELRVNGFFVNHNTFVTSTHVIKDLFSETRYVNSVPDWDSLYIQQGDQRFEVELIQVMSLISDITLIKIKDTTNRFINLFTNGHSNGSIALNPDGRFFTLASQLSTSNSKSNSNTEEASDQKLNIISVPKLYKQKLKVDYLEDTSGSESKEIDIAYDFFINTDREIHAHQVVGLPVVDVKGSVVGMVISTDGHYTSAVASDIISNSLSIPVGDSIQNGLIQEYTEVLDLAQRGKIFAQYILGMFFSYGYNWSYKDSKLAQVGLLSTTPPEEVQKSSSVNWITALFRRHPNSTPDQVKLKKIADYQQAIKWLELASNADYVVAQFLLGVAYQKMSELDESESERYQKLSEKWFKEAAIGGHPGAELALGLMYLEQGGEHHLIRAKEWLTRAKDWGSQRADMHLSKISNDSCQKSMSDS